MRFRAEAAVSNVNHDISQMKDEITSKDHRLVKEHFDHHKVRSRRPRLGMS